jgi:phosphotransferase system  glucose/maltose/N-acetylglucosamine-specific IIC component
LLFLAAFLAFGVIVVRLPRLFPEATRPRRLLTWLLAALGLAWLLAALGLAGVAAFARVIVIDLLVGFRADSHAEMGRIDDEHATSPGDLSAGFYEITEEVGPLPLQVGLIGLLALLAYTRPRVVPRWSPIVALLAFAPIIVSLALLPLAALLFFVALPAARGGASVAESALVIDKKETQ